MPPDVKSFWIDAAVIQQTLEKKLADLPPFPAVVTRIMQSVNNPEISAEDLNKLISMDQGLSSKVLRIVNSSYYGFPKRISTISDAVVILGFNTVRNLVLGVSAFGLLGQKTLPYGLDRSRFWEHSIATATAAGVIARKRLPKLRSAPDEVFVGGLLHDLGALFLDSYFPVQFSVAMAFADSENKTACEAENMVLGMDHVAVGRRIAEYWNFPPQLAAIMGGHHDPVRETEHLDMVALVHAGNWFAWELGFVPSEHTSQHPLDPVIVEWLAFDEATIETVKADILVQVRACKDLLRPAKDAR